MDSHDKAKFRNTKKWKLFRQKLKKERKRDELTGSPLTKLYNLHHMYETDREDIYTDLSDESKFLCLNVKSHDLIEFCYSHATRDPDFMTRLNEIITEMLEINK